MVNGRPPTNRRSASEERTQSRVGTIRTSQALMYARIASQLTQQELALHSGVPLGTVEAIETGEMRFPPARVVQKLEAVLGVELA